MVEKFNALLDLAKAELPYAILLVVCLIMLLSALANALINWSKATPDPADDAELAEDAAKLNVIVQFFKDLFKLNKN